MMNKEASSATANPQMRISAQLRLAHAHRSSMSERLAARNTPEQAPCPSIIDIFYHVQAEKSMDMVILIELIKLSSDLAKKS
jgi:hypothetical protein